MSQNDEAVDDDPKVARPRNPNRPSLTLEAAIEKVGVLHQKYNRSPAAVPLVCKCWGYQNPRSSGALQTIAAVKAYGLIDVTGIGPAQKIAVSEAADRIIRVAPDRPERLKAAALLPTLHREVWSHFGNKMPPDDDLAQHYLMWDRPDGARFTDETSAQEFMDNLRTTLRFAGITSPDGSPARKNKTGGLDTSDNGSGPEDLKGEVRVGSFVQWTSAGVDQFPEPRQVLGTRDDWVFVEGSGAGIPMSEVSVVEPPAVDGLPPSNPYFKPGEEIKSRPGTSKSQWKLDEGDAVLAWPDNLSKESVGDLEYWLKGVVKRLRRKAGIEEESSSESSGL